MGRVTEFIDFINTEDSKEGHSLKWHWKKMGRAIDMERDIDMLKREVKEVKDILKDILEGVKTDDKKETKKANTKRSKASSGKSDSRPNDSE